MLKYSNFKYNTYTLNANKLAQKIEREIAILKSDLESHYSMYGDLALFSLSKSTSVGSFQQYLKQ